MGGAEELILKLKSRLKSIGSIPANAGTGKLGFAKRLILRIKDQILHFLKGLYVEITRCLKAGQAALARLKDMREQMWKETPYGDGKLKEPAIRLMPMP